MTAPIVEQARALISLRATLWWRRIVHGRQWARATLGVIAALLGALISVTLCVAALGAGQALRRHPERIWERGGPLAVFTAWLTLAVAGRLWFGLVALAQSQGFVDPRRFRSFPVSPRLLSALNLAALFADPVWLLLYPPLFALALAVSRFPGAPALWTLLCGEALAIWAVVGVLHLGGALAALFDARPVLRRALSVLLLLAGFIGFQLSLSAPDDRGMSTLFESRAWRAWTPPGWAALLAQALSSGRLLAALGYGLLLLLLGFASSAAAHALSLREQLRPPESGRASRAAARGDGWRLPLSGPALSALFEKEAKTAVRVGWLQLVIVPVAYLLLVRAVLPGPEPLLIAAVYAHLGVLEIATNAFGRDLDAARAWFLWPVKLRAVLFAKNAVAYCFSLAVFLLLVAVAAFGRTLSPGQVLIGVLAHAATFPLLATFGNAASVVYPVPVRGARLRRVRGAGPVGARLSAMLLLAGAAWAPYAIAQALGLHLYAAYLGEMIALLVAYPALLGAAAHLAERRKELLLSTLARDE
ncbi:MAG TPA: hypothetical protein VMK66_00345 [Myxococcales bacterium]|nr:hypothetical protein [Myxococcales bacterium]